MPDDYMLLDEAPRQLRAAAAPERHGRKLVSSATGCQKALDRLFFALFCGETKKGASRPCSGSFPSLPGMPRPGSHCPEQRFICVPQSLPLRHRSVSRSISGRGNASRCPHRHYSPANPSPARRESYMEQILNAPFARKSRNRGLTPEFSRLSLIYLASSPVTIWFSLSV